MFFTKSIDLSSSGLPISLKGAILRYTSDVVTAAAPLARTIDEVRPFLRDTHAATNVRDIYVMYRGITLRTDQELFHTQGLRYDITILTPGLLGREFHKTIGHFHAVKPGTDVTYPEVYEVLYGKALFLFQQGKDEYSLPANVGEKVVVPPGFGHITINIGNTPLVTANLSIDGVPSLYDFYKNHQGAAYYVVSTERGIADPTFGVEKNMHYDADALLQMAVPRELPALGIDFKTPLYTAFVRTPHQFDYLKNPEHHLDALLPRKVFHGTH